MFKPACYLDYSFERFESCFLVDVTERFVLSGLVPFNVMNFFFLSSILSSMLSADVSLLRLIIGIL